jgi:hypothetical protein
MLRDGPRDVQVYTLRELADESPDSFLRFDDVAGARRFAERLAREPGNRPLLRRLLRACDPAADLSRGLAGPALGRVAELLRGGRLRVFDPNAEERARLAAVYAPTDGEGQGAPATFEKPCDVVMAYNLRGDTQATVGYVTKLKVGTYSFVADQEVTIPDTNRTAKKVIGVLRHLSWDGGVGDPFRMTAHLSTASQQLALEALLGDLANSKVEFQAEVWDFDHSANPPKYYRSILSSAALEGAILKEAGALCFSVEYDPYDRVPSPQNYAMTLAVMPAEKDQDVTVATSATKTRVRAWGTTGTVESKVAKPKGAETIQWGASRQQVIVRKDCDAVQAFQGFPDRQARVGHVLSLEIAGEKLYKDLNLDRPDKVAEKGRRESVRYKVIGPIEEIAWVASIQEETDPEAEAEEKQEREEEERRDKVRELSEELGERFSTFLREREPRLSGSFKGRSVPPDIKAYMDNVTRAVRTFLDGGAAAMAKVREDLEDEDAGASIASLFDEDTASRESAEDAAKRFIERTICELGAEARTPDEFEDISALFEDDDEEAVGESEPDTSKDVGDGELDEAFGALAEGIFGVFRQGWKPGEQGDPMLMLKEADDALGARLLQGDNPLAAIGDADDQAELVEPYRAQLHDALKKAYSEGLVAMFQETRRKEMKQLNAAMEQLLKGETAAWAQKEPRARKLFGRYLQWLETAEDKWQKSASEDVKKKAKDEKKRRKEGERKAYLGIARSKGRYTKEQIGAIERIKGRGRKQGKTEREGKDQGPYEENSKRLSAYITAEAIRRFLGREGGGDEGAQPVDLAEAGVGACLERWGEGVEFGYGDIGSLFDEGGGEPGDRGEELSGKVLAYLQPPEDERERFAGEAVVGTLLEEVRSFFEGYVEKDSEALEEQLEEMIETRMERLPSAAERKREARKAMREHRKLYVPNPAELAVIGVLNNRLVQILDVEPEQKLTVADRKRMAQKELMRKLRKSRRATQVKKRVQPQLELSFRVSAVNKEMLTAISHLDELEDAVVKIEYVVYEYDPLAPGWFASFCTHADVPIEARLAGEVDVDDKPTGEPQRPINFTASLTLKPTTSSQEVMVAAKKAGWRALEWIAEDS